MKENSYGVIPVFRNEDGNFLFLTIQHHEGHWGFPKGKKDSDDETDEEAAKRELKEEAGIRKVELVHEPVEEHYEFVRGGKIIQKTITYFIGLTSAKEVIIQEEEIRDFSWLPFEEARGRLTYDEAKGVLEKAYNYLLTN